jgi:hypothetical protein
MLSALAGRRFQSPRSSRTVHQHGRLLFLLSRGFQTRWVRPPNAVGDLAPEEVVMELTVIRGSDLLPGGIRAESLSKLQVRRSAIDQYLIELVDQAVWVEGIRRMMADPRLEERQWPTYRGEDRTWR